MNVNYIESDIKLSDTIERKITQTIDMSDYEIMTDTGWIDLKFLHQTIKYDAWYLKLKNSMYDNYDLIAADNHIVFKLNIHNHQYPMIEVFVKDLEPGDFVYTKDGYVIVEEVKSLDYKISMYDFELTENSNSRYYTNNILSHNTQLAKELTKFLFDSEDSLIRVDMSEYMEKFSVNRIVGAPPGYVGHEEGGQLTEKVRRKPYSVILFDEIEKAHPEIFNILLQVLDDGQLTDAQGRKVDFKNTIIIMTSNIGAQEMNSFGKEVGFNRTSEQIQLNSSLETALRKVFRPEFLNRIDDVITFERLTQENVNQILNSAIEPVKKRISQYGYSIELSENAMKFLSEKGYDEKFGARPLKRAIQKYVEDPIANIMLDTELKSYRIFIDKDPEEDKLTYEKFSIEDVVIENLTTEEEIIENKPKRKKKG